MVPDRLVVLRGPNVAISIYPADLAVTGAPDAVARARALVARDVPSTDAWFTTTKEAQQLEDRMAALERASPAERGAALEDVDRRLLDLTVDEDTFEVLYRRRLQLAVPASMDVRDDAEPEPAQPRPGTDGRGPGRRVTAGGILGIVVAVLAAADLILTRWWTRGGRRGGRDRS
jgi:hypothetical protein